jgi:hypothetical protein
MSDNAKDILKFIGALAAIPLLIYAFLYFISERHTKLNVLGGNPPQFQMSGSGTLGALRITGHKKQREAVGPDAVTYWMIEPENGYAKGEAIEILSPITYGKIPRGYVQTYPEQGEAPSLVEGEIYTIHAETFNANHGIKRFFMEAGKAVEMLN